MMKRIAPCLASVALLAVAGQGPVFARVEDDGEAFAVVVHAGNPIASLSASGVEKIFMKKTVRWPDQTTIEPVDAVLGSALRRAFTAHVFRQSPAAIQRYWQRQMFSGNGTPPVVLASPQAILDFVAGSPGAVGYLPCDLAADPRVRPVLVHGCDHLTPMTASSGGWGQTETLAVHGGIHLLLAGTCGAVPGRRVVIQNQGRNRTVQTTVEVARWINGQPRSRSTEVFALGGGAEVALGCTHPGPGTENRYRLVEVSDAAVDAGRRAPAVARDAVAFVEGGSCGRGGRGRRLSVVNRHPHRTVAVVVGVVSEIGGRPHRRFERSLRLGAGRSERLGCTVDGTVVQRFSLVSADFG